MSLRELVATLASHANHACHLGRGPIRRSTLTEANAKRPLALYEALLGTLLDQLQRRLARHAPRRVKPIFNTAVWKERGYQ